MLVHEKKIIVCCSQGITGGPELLHQLVHELRQIGRNAQIAYHPFDQPFETPDPYKIYDVVQGELTDDTDTFVIIPEAATNLAKYFKHARIGIWWLSVDNYFGIAGKSWGSDLARSLKSLLKGQRLRLSQIKNCLHFTQSAYAEDFLQKAKITSTPLTDYLGQTHLSERTDVSKIERGNIVVYNPKKGRAITETLISAYPDINFVPIQNMTSHEVAKTMRSAKLYIDFGNHPGKDRPPREAAMAGCCVVTGARGSAKYFEDVSIPSYYKLNEKSSSFVENFGVLARDILENYESHYPSFEKYRAKIIAEPIIFKEQVKSIFAFSEET